MSEFLNQPVTVGDAITCMLAGIMYQFIYHFISGFLGAFIAACKKRR